MAYTTPSPVSVSAAGPSKVTVELLTKKFVAVTAQPSGSARSSGIESHARAWQSDAPPPETNSVQPRATRPTASAAKPSARGHGKVRPAAGPAFVTGWTGAGAAPV